MSLSLIYSICNGPNSVKENAWTMNFISFCSFVILHNIATYGIIPYHYDHLMEFLFNIDCTACTVRKWERGRNEIIALEECRESLVSFSKASADIERKKGAPIHCRGQGLSSGCSGLKRSWCDERHLCQATDKWELGESWI